jgi:glycosyltransferase involved in cell wall biosynthesis
MAHPMRVLHIYRTYFPDPPGGLQEAIRQISAGCKSLGVESAIYTLSPNPSPAVIERPEGTVVRGRSYWAPASCDLGGPAEFQLFRERVSWADVLHFHFPWPFADLLNLLPGKRRPKVMTYHSDIVKQRVLGRLYQPLMKHTLGDMDAVVATSPAYASTSEVLRRFVAPERLKVIPLGMNEPEPPASNATGEGAILDRLGLRGQPFVLALGVLRYYKGLHHLVEAARSIRGTVVLAGSGPEEPRLRELARRSGIDNVVFAGQVSDTEKHALLAACSALCLSSHLRSEAYGMVLLEAAMHARPLVSCEIGTGTSFINADGVTGHVVPPEDPQALALAINRLLDDPQAASAMGRQARQRYETRFTGDIMAGAYLDLYRSVAGHA